MKIIRDVATMGRWSRKEARPLVLVPTMGALHEGHLALFKKARKLAGEDGRVVVSIFVNPIQFGPKEDLSRYPRPFEKDARLCKKASVDAIFHPSPEEIYPKDFSTSVNESLVSRELCGASRPGHFNGVCTVVLKLFQIIQPDISVFGLKDYQQCQVLRRMVRDLNVPVKMVLEETVREADGLALSSRNVYLNPEERNQAPVIRKALLAARDAYRAGKCSAAKLSQIATQIISRATLAKVDYLSVMDGESLTPIKQVKKNDVLAAAVFFGRTRLIDNIILK